MRMRRLLGAVAAAGLLLAVPSASASPRPIGHAYFVEAHQFGVKTNARAAVRRYSDFIVATPNAVEVALRQTVNAPWNEKYLPYYQRTGGYWPAQSRIFVHVVEVQASRSVRNG